MKDNAERFMVQRTLYFLVWKLTLQNDGQALVLAPHKTEQQRCREWHHLGWAAKQGGTC